mgnify:CR=1 FL=1
MTEQHVGRGAAEGLIFAAPHDGMVMPGGWLAATIVVARKAATIMVLFGFWLLAGLALGMILMAFLAIGTYQRGYEAGYVSRKFWRTELEARRTAFANAYDRGALAASPRVEVSLAAETPLRVAAAS